MMVSEFKLIRPQSFCQHLQALLDADASSTRSSAHSLSPSSPPEFSDPSLGSPPGRQEIPTPSHLDRSLHSSKIVSSSVSWVHSNPHTLSYTVTSGSHGMMDVKTPCKAAQYMGGGLLFRTSKRFLLLI